MKALEIVGKIVGNRQLLTVFVVICLEAAAFWAFCLSLVSCLLPHFLENEAFVAVAALEINIDACLKLLGQGCSHYFQAWSRGKLIML